MVRYSIPIALLLVSTIAIAHEGELTGLQVVAGYITWMNILLVLGAGVGVISFVYLFGSWISELMKIFQKIPKEVYEVFLYIISIVAMGGAWLIPINEPHYVAFVGCLLFAGAIILTVVLHELEENLPRFFTTLMVVWAIVALAYGSSLIGFIAVIALMGALGFSILITPLTYCIGFKDEAAIGRATTAAFLILGFFILLRQQDALADLLVFEKGALWMGSFVGYLGLLIASTRWYDSKFDYPVMQLVTIIAGMGALFFGSVLAIPELLGIGGTFFVLYLLEKPFEIPAAESMKGRATIALFVSVCVFLGALWGKEHMDIIEPYLLF